MTNSLKPCTIRMAQFHLTEHTLKEDMEIFRIHPGLVFGMVACPILGMMAMVCIMPIAYYVTEHDTFKDLHIIRPDHLMRLIYRVHKSLYRTSGKLATKID